MHRLSDDTRCIRCQKTHKYDTPDGVAIDTYRFCINCCVTVGKDFSPRVIFDTLAAYKTLENLDKRDVG